MELHLRFRTRVGENPLPAGVSAIVRTNGCGRKICWKDQHEPVTVVSMLSMGIEAPLFSLLDQDETLVNLIDQRGHWLLLWWYPKASTPG